MGYCQLLLQVYRKLHPNGPDPIIIPVVVYNGEEPWELPYAAISPRELERIFRGDNAFRYALVDLAHMSPRRMRSHAPDPQARAWLRLMGWYPAAGKWALVRIFRGLPDDGPTKELALCYTGSSKDVPVELGDWAWAKAKPHLKEEKPMTTIAEEYTAKGRVEGRTEDRAEGRAEALRRMLERRFGALPKHARAQIDAAPLAQLDAWLDAVLDADSVDAVLTNGARSAA